MYINNGLTHKLETKFKQQQAIQLLNNAGVKKLRKRLETYTDLRISAFFFRGFTCSILTLTTLPGLSQCITQTQRKTSFMGGISCYGCSYKEVKLTCLSRRECSRYWSPAGVKSPYPRVKHTSVLLLPSPESVRPAER
jgi:hypothetical protein